ncbi:hypothetical protein BE21_35970 [Sorangium cellulosum]|uniref:FAD-binding domain-containing protein n=1 Tax=Sorangium cellulosum TaxID=56 RepID=A0A150TNH5_SORCE|nr:hypothetical protein BE21_35970 [Sorangium cellulosum]
MPRRVEVDACVIGGGPAGSTAARRLAELGHSVCLVEREAEHGRRIGESLPPSILPLLQAAGVLARVEAAGFLRPEGAVVRWGAADEATGRSPAARGFLVDRARFDALLLDAAREAGVVVLRPAFPGAPARRAPLSWQIPVRASGEPVLVDAHVLIEATGKHGPRRRRRARTSEPTLALHGYWQGARLGGLEARVEAGPDAWYWGAPLPAHPAAPGVAGPWNACVFVDPARVVGLDAAGLARLYGALLEESSLLRGCLAGALEGSVRVCDASAYMDASPAEPGALLVGEASFSIDPLSSQGVQVAMSSALHGAIAARTFLISPADAEAAVAFCVDRQREAVARSRRTAAQIYAEQGRFAERPFWARRARLAPENADPPARRPAPPLSLERRLRLSEALEIRPTPAIAGDVIRRVAALHHPALERPAAYLGDVALAPLLADVAAGRSAGGILARWTQRMPPRRGEAVLQFLWETGIVVPDA